MNHVTPHTHTDTTTPHRAHSMSYERIMRTWVELNTHTHTWNTKTPVRRVSFSFHCLLFCVPVMSEFRHWLNMIYQVLNFLIKSFWFNKTKQHKGLMRWFLRASLHPPSIVLNLFMIIIIYTFTQMKGHYTIPNYVNDRFVFIFKPRAFRNLTWCVWLLSFDEKIHFDELRLATLAHRHLFASHRCVRVVCALHISIIAMIQRGNGKEKEKKWKNKREGNKLLRQEKINYCSFMHRDRHTWRREAIKQPAGYTDHTNNSIDARSTHSHGGWCDGRYIVLPALWGATTQRHI